MGNHSQNTELELNWGLPPNNDKKKNDSTRPNSNLQLFHSLGLLHQTVDNCAINTGWCKLSQRSC